jgi:hypothetical protein
MILCVLLLRSKKRITTSSKLALYPRMLSADKSTPKIVLAPEQTGVPQGTEQRGSIVTEEIEVAGGGTGEI